MEGKQQKVNATGRFELLTLRLFWWCEFPVREEGGAEEKDLFVIWGGIFFSTPPNLVWINAAALEDNLAQPLKKKKSSGRAKKMVGFSDCVLKGEKQHKNR